MLNAVVNVGKKYGITSVRPAAAVKTGYTFFCFRSENILKKVFTYPQAKPSSTE